MEPPARHESQRGAFTVREDGTEGALAYTRSGPSSVAFVHTCVPQALRGQGIAERLGAAGLSWARHPGWNDLRPEEPSS